MKNNEHLALFVLGVATLGITFLLLIALSDRDSASIPAVDKQIAVSSAEAAPVPQAQPQVPATQYTSMDVIDRQVADTFAKTVAYLGRGVYEEKEHIALLERLEFYGGMSSIKPEIKQTAQDYIKDMNRLLTLKESVARNVKLAGQITAIETDVQIHIAQGAGNKAEAQKLMERLEHLYSIQGLTEGQNRQLRTSIAALKKAYTAPKKHIATASASSSQKEEPASVPVVRTVKVEPTPEPKPVQQVAAVVKETPVPAPKVESTPVQKAQEPRKTQRPDTQVIQKKYSTVMTQISRYFVVKKYNQEYHAELLADLHDLSEHSSVLSSSQKEKLTQTIAKMEELDKRFRR